MYNTRKRVVSGDGNKAKQPLAKKSKNVKSKMSVANVNKLDKNPKNADVDGFQADNLRLSGGETSKNNSQNVNKAKKAQIGNSKLNKAKGKAGFSNECNDPQMDQTESDSHDNSQGAHISNVEGDQIFETRVQGGNESYCETESSGDEGEKTPIQRSRPRSGEAISDEQNRDLSSDGKIQEDSDYELENVEQKRKPFEMTKRERREKI